MSLIVEDGSGVAGAESYISVAAALTYFSNRGNTVWTGLSTPTQEQSLRLATDYMTQMYHDRWAGFRYNVNQSLDWPRVWVPIFDVASSYGPTPNFVSPTIVPQLIQNACAELASRANSLGSLAPDIDRIEQVVQIGPIKVEYDLTAPPFTLYRQVDAMLSQYLSENGGATVRVRRT